MSSSPADALSDPAVTVVVTRLEDAAVQVRTGWPIGMAVPDGTMVTATGVVAVAADATLAAALAGDFDDARTALLGRPDGHRLLGAVAVGQWRARTRFCSRCGASLQPAADGRSLRCEQGHQDFPRLEPAVIMRVVDHDDRILLARQPRWPVGRFSVLAGFVDPGETLEDAVRREVMEEVGIPVQEVSYVTSQPWPFPSSLMLAFACRAADTHIRLLDGEIAEADWFTRDRLVAAMAEGAVALPPPLSVAHRLVRAWMGAPLRTWG